MERNERKPRRRPRHPVFDLVMVDEGRSLKWLARQIGYSHQHVRNVAAGQFGASDRFRARCARLLGRDEDDLFLGPGDDGRPIAAAS